MKSMEIKKNKLLTIEGFFIDLDNKVLALSDLHIGFEEEVGLLVRQQIDKIIRDINRIYEKYNIEKIIICGDVKHNFGKNKQQEWEEIERLMKKLNEYGEIVITKGNHDNYIENMVKGYAKVVDSITIGDVTYSHGHKKIKRKGLLVIGNEHPIIRLNDQVGARYSYKVFLYFRKEDILVLPASNIWTRGTNVLNAYFISEELKKVDREEAEVYIIDKKIIPIGKIKQIRMLIDGKI